MCARARAYALQVPMKARGIGFLGAGVQGGCEPIWILRNSDLLQEQCMLLTTELSLHQQAQSPPSLYLLLEQGFMKVAAIAAL